LEKATDAALRAKGDAALRAIGDVNLKDKIMDDLSAVFSETDDTEEAEVEVEEQTPDGEEETQVDGQAETEASEEESTVEDDATTTVAEQDEAKTQESDKDNWTYAAYQDEKEKRQALETRVKELEAKEGEAENPDDVITRQEAQATVANALFQDRLSRNYESVKDKYDDFPEMEKAFVEMASKDKTLADKFKHASNPPEFAYVQAKNASLLAKYDGNISAMLEDVQKQQEITKTEEVKPKPSKPKTPSLADATESEKNSEAVEEKDTSKTLSSLFEDSPF